MKAVLVGSDLLYRRDGKLVPVEINTNVGWDENGRVEPVEELFNLADIKAFVEAHNIEKIYLEGTVGKAFKAFKAEFPDLTIENISQEEYEEKAEEENALAIRTFYSDEALVDSFCRDKTNFLKSIKGTSLEVEYLLKTEEGLEGEITDLNLYEDNLPNFILKYRYPSYNHKNYPAFYRFKSIEDLYEFANSDRMPEDFFLMPFYYNPNKLYEGERIQLVRNWSVYVANDEGSLDSLYLGKYTKICGKFDESQLVWNEDGSLAEGREMLVDNLWFQVPDKVNDAMLEETDLVWMADGTWKEAKDLKEGDEIMSIEVPTGDDVDITKHSEVDYNVSLEEFQAETEYRVNTITDIERQVGFYDVLKMNFTDGTDWFDTVDSSYPILDPEDGTVMFRELKNLKVGDKVILSSLEATEEGASKPQFIVQEIESIEKERVEFEGIAVSTDGSHLVLSRTSEDAGAYISIEHNANVCDHGAYNLWDPPFSGTCTNAACSNASGATYRYAWCSTNEGGVARCLCGPMSIAQGQKTCGISFPCLDEG